METSSSSLIIMEMMEESRRRDVHESCVGTGTGSLGRRSRLIDGGTKPAGRVLGSG